MADKKFSPEVMETFRKVKEANEQRKTDLVNIEALDEFERAIGKPDTESEKFTQQSKIEISKVDSELKKRGV